MPKSRRPVSPQRLAANRANAARSTGPRSPEGKARSAQNARKHQFTGSTFAVVRLEDLQEIAHLRDDLIALYQPVNSQEIFALERVALAQHAILRGALLESGFFTTCLDVSFDNGGEPIRLMDPTIAGDGDIEVTRAQNRNFLLGDGFHRMARESNSFGLLLRYLAQAERHYRRAIEEFERLKALRDEFPIEPITEPDLEPKTTTYPDPPTNPNSQSGTSLQSYQAGKQPQVRDAEVTAEAIRLENGSNPSVCSHKARRAVVGQVVKLRPIGNRPLARVRQCGPGFQGQGRNPETRENFRKKRAVNAVRLSLGVQ
jgi:hypothetical protein